MSTTGMAGGGANDGFVEVDCIETVEVLYTFLDGELTEERRRSIQIHLDKCPPCLDKYDFASDLRRLVADRCKDHVPDQLRERIAQAISDDANSRG